MKSAIAILSAFAALVSAAKPDGPRHNFHFRRTNDTNAALTTMTVFATHVHTVISCAPTITNCPADKTAISALPQTDQTVVVVTDTVLLTTTVCPVKQAASISTSLLGAHSSGNLPGSTLPAASTPVAAVTSSPPAAVTASSSAAVTYDTPAVVTSATAEAVVVASGSGVITEAPYVTPAVTSSGAIVTQAGSNDVGNTPSPTNDETTTITATGTSTTTITITLSEVSGHATATGSSSGGSGGNYSGNGGSNDSGNGSSSNGSGSGSGSGNGGTNDSGNGSSNGSGNNSNQGVDSGDCDTASTVTVTAPASTVTLPASTVYVTVDSNASPTTTMPPLPTGAITESEVTANAGQDEDCITMTTTMMTTVTMPYSQGNATASSGYAASTGFLRLRR